MGYDIIFQPEKLEKDSDIYALLIEKKVSVTPITIDLTSRTDLDALANLLDD
jgi:broad specificity polyphosphatase/5'/3'-nucleotidase SurE